MSKTNENIKYNASQITKIKGRTKDINPRVTTEQFILKAIKKHGNKYDYSNVNYINSKIKIAITCREHGPYLQVPAYHLSGNGCMKCGKKSLCLSIMKTKEQFIEEANIIHNNKYDYSKVEYINTQNKVTILCNLHGEFKQTPNKHISCKSGCNKCGFLSSSLKQRKSTEQFIKDAQMIHGDRYDYSKVNYTMSQEKVIIICKTHGEFEQIACEHLRKRCVNCPRCNPHFSKMQIQWLDLLSKMYNIHIQHAVNGIEHTIKTTQYKADGYCKETNTIYEFNGDFWHGNPKLYKPDDTTYFGVTYGNLYQKTVKREELIKSLGYNLVVMWEYDWKKIIHFIKILQRKIRKLFTH